MKDISIDGLRKAAEEFAEREDEHALHDLEVEVGFWLAVEECAICEPGRMCSGHYERMVLCL
jgi:hypothetical protein